MKFTMLLLPLLFIASPLLADEVRLHGIIHSSSDISAAAFFGDTLVIGSDEAIGIDENENYIQLLDREGNGFRVARDILVYRGNKKLGRELDIEGIAVENNKIFVAGSHSLARKRIKVGSSYKKSLKRLTTIKPEPGRKQVIRITLGNDRKVVERASVSLANILESDPILAPFAAIPSKENGIDIEAIAAREGKLYLGFRGPVLRDGYVPILQFEFDNPENNYHLHWLNLGGLGIRDMTAVDDGFLILSGPMADSPRTFRLYHWNGLDSLENTTLKPLREIDPPSGGKAEALALESVTPTHYNVLILFDGIEGGAPHRYTIPR